MQFDELLGYIDHILSFKLFQIQQTPVNVSSLFMFLLVIILFFILSRILCRIFLKRVMDRMRLEEATQYNLNRITHYLVMLTGALVSFQFVGIDLSGLMMVFGLLSVGIGFGLQNITSNFISGLILLFERPIKVGDRITIGNTEGDVMEISMRSTIIRSLNNISIIVPNSEFVSSQVVNWSHRDLKIRLDIDVGVSYDSDLEKVLQSLREVAAENEDVLPKPRADVLHLGFGDSSWNMRLRVWIANPKRHLLTRSAINCAIVRKFRENNIEIPFPQRDLHIRSPLPLPLTSEK
ncbi:MAG: mechanosensitive ion channel domain-containing protein [Thermodesulfobacteriota bacterium]